MKKEKNKIQHLTEKQRLIRIIILIVTLLIMFLIFSLRQSLINYTRYGLLGIFLINLFSSASVVFPVPGAASIFIGGALWGPLLVGLVSGIGTSIGELTGYMVGYGGSGIVSRTKNKIKIWITFKKIFHKHGFLTILIIAIIPLPIFDYMGILAGSMGYPIYKYYLATLIGRTIRNYIFAVAGARILP
ncbi:VTT domain-containing protein [Candidatus Gottesmanbacteria bacterium]|nr:VTT domain-containing protein [Candidatus Gottesmanbacteria bacterium]